MSVPSTDSAKPALPDFSRMTEDEQIAYALQMSMQGSAAGQTWTSCSYLSHYRIYSITVKGVFSIHHIKLSVTV